MYIVVLVFLFLFTDKKMGDKELNDPINKMSLIKGKSALLFLFFF